MFVKPHHQRMRENDQEKSTVFSYLLESASDDLLMISKCFSMLLLCGL